jgi:NCAIR mutase (PurE)-related protein
MVDQRSIRRWMRQLRNGARAPHTVLEELRRLPFDDLGFARLDTHRRLRRGLPEIILGEGKTPAQLIRIAQRLLEARELLLITRVSPVTFGELHRAVPALRYDPVARLAYHPGAGRRTSRGCALVVTGGTSDLPIAEEAAVTLSLLGSRALRLYDVGVAGVHRLFNQWRLLSRARVIIVVAGMEGALASVVAGLVAAPVIAVPTSVGYGAAFQGLAPLLAMLNSCVPGIGVVNIDNGFGAAYLAHVINCPPSRGKH